MFCSPCPSVCDSIIALQVANPFDSENSGLGAVFPLPDSKLMTTMTKTSATITPMHPKPNFMSLFFPEGRMTTDNVSPMCSGS